jgi:hypothetical protein
MEKIKLGSPGILVIFLFNFTWELLFQVNEVNLSIYQNKFTKQAKTYLSFSNVQVSSVFLLLLLELLCWIWLVFGGLFGARFPSRAKTCFSCCTC